MSGGGSIARFRPRRALAPCLILSVAALLLAAGDARSEPEPWRRQISDGGTNTEWGECMGREVAAQEARLAVALREALARLPEKSRTDLIAEQQAWTAFKEKSCLLWANGDWGRQGQVLSWGACRSAIVRQRVKYLQDLADDLRQREGEDEPAAPPGR